MTHGIHSNAFGSFALHEMLDSLLRLGRELNEKNAGSILFQHAMFSDTRLIHYVKLDWFIQLARRFFKAPLELPKLTWRNAWRPVPITKSIFANYSSMQKKSPEERERRHFPCLPLIFFRGCPTKKSHSRKDMQNGLNCSWKDFIWLWLRTRQTGSSNLASI